MLLESILKVTETSAVEVARKVVIKFTNRSKSRKIQYESRVSSRISRILMILDLGFQHSSLIHRLVCQLDGKLSVSSSDIMLLESILKVTETSAVAAARKVVIKFKIRSKNRKILSQS